MNDDLAALALKERICDATDRIPTFKWPFFSTTVRCTIPIGGTTCTLVFEAERDTLLTDLSITAAENDDIQLPGGVDIEYCNVAYAEHTNISEWAFCCSRKPIFLVGVRENKRLRIVVTLAGVQDEAVEVTATLTGWQGVGCCD